MAKQYLKLQNTTVMEWDQSTGYYKVLEENMLPIVIRGKIVDTSNIKDDAKRENIAKSNTETLYRDFLGRRQLSVNKKHAQEICKCVDIQLERDNIKTTAKIMKMCKGLSAIDDYWIAEDNKVQKAENQRWENVNLRTNPLNKTLAYIALEGINGAYDIQKLMQKIRNLTITNREQTAELTGQGSYAKGWFREKGTLTLCKGDESCPYETKAEAITSKVLDCFNVPHVHYDLIKNSKGSYITKCALLNNDTYSIVDAENVDSYTTRTQDQDVFKFAEELNPSLYYKTIVMDYLCSNRDRHTSNWGFYMNNKTGDIVDIHPLYDHNNAFDKDVMKDPSEEKCKMVKGETITLKKMATKIMTDPKLRKICDLRCIKAVTRDMFITSDSDKDKAMGNIMYQSFISRAVELGLYKKHKLSITESIKAAKGNYVEQYEPVSIEKDNTQKYWDNIKMTLMQQNNSQQQEIKRREQEQRAQETTKQETGETLTRKLIDFTVENRKAYGSIEKSCDAAVKNVLGSDPETSAINRTMVRQHIQRATGLNRVDTKQFIIKQAEQYSRYSKVLQGKLHPTRDGYDIGRAI